MAKRERKARPFPHRCPECGAKEVFPATVTHKSRFKYEGRLYEFEARSISANKCRACGELILTNTALEQIADAFRAHAGLLTTTEIADNLGRLRLTQKEFAERIGVASETVSRWLGSVQIQSRALDNLMRLFFRFSIVRDALAEAKQRKPIVIQPADDCIDPTSVQPVALKPAVPEPLPGACVFHSECFSRRFSQDVWIRRQRFELVPGRN